MGVEIAAALGLAGTAATVAAFVINVALSVVVSSVLAKKPKSGGAVAPDRDQMVTVRDPIAAGRVIYGQARVGGVMVFIHTTPQTVGLEATTSHEVTIPVSGTVTVDQSALYLSTVQVYFGRYDSDSGNYEYDTQLTEVGGVPATGEYAVSAGVYTFAAADAGQVAIIVYKITAGTSVVGKYLHLVLELACHEVEEIGDVYFNDELVPLSGGDATGRLAGYAYVGKHLGTDAQTADSVLMAAAPSKWTTEHRLRGRAYVYVRLLKSDTVFPSGVPNITAVVKGRKVYDPRTTLTAWSENPALCITDYLTNSNFGLGHVYADEIEEDLLTAAANECEEAVTLDAGGTEDRYTCNGTFLTSERPVDIIGRMQVAMAGRVVRSGGKWDIYAGAYIAAAVTLDEDDLRGAIKVQPRLSRRDLFNAVKGVYISAANAYQPADFPPVTSSTYYGEDDSERIWEDMDLQFTNSPSMAQRLAKIELERMRQQITVVAPFKLSAYQVKPPQTVMLTNSKFGWTDKVFEVAEARLVTEQGADGSPYIGVDLTLRETASTVYDWSSSEETAVDPAPDTDLPNPFAVAPPGTPSVVETLYETTGSAGVKSRATMSWLASPDAQAVNYQPEYRLAAATTWTVLPLVRGLSVDIEDLAAGTYRFRVRAINRIGAASQYSIETAAEIYGLTAAPSDVTGFSVIKTSGVGIAQWTVHPDLDVQINGAIVIRHSPLTSGATWVDGVIVEEFPGGLISGIVPLITGTYMAKARDSSGNYSATMVDFVATEGMITGFTTADTVTEHTGFTGTKTNVVLDGGLGGIQLDTGDLTGTYEFANVLDATTVATRRFESDITAQSYDDSVNIDSIAELIDTWGPIDGGEVNDCDVTLYAATTDDDPAGTPTWGSWTPFFVADFTCRGAKFKLDFVRVDPNHNIVVTELSVAAKDPA